MASKGVSYRYYPHIIVLVFTVLTLGFSALVINEHKTLVRQTALNTAELYAGAVSEFRSIYTSEVIARLPKGGMVTARHDYLEHAGAVPLPATLSILLGKRIGQGLSGAEVKLYSDYPFPWREQDGGLKDEFSEHAWQNLNQLPSQPYFQFVDNNGEPFLRYAKVDLMRKQCLDCHNNHPQTPKADWLEGDVRGVLEINLPLGEVVASSEQRLYIVFMAYSIISIVCIGLFIWIIRTLRMTSVQLREQARRLLDEVETRKKLEIEAKRSQHLAESANKAKSQFLSTMSHELRTPMNAIIGFTTILIKKRKPAEDQKMILQRVLGASNTLLGLINDILDLDKVESGKMHLEYIPLDLRKEFDEVYSLFHEQAKEKSISLDIHCSELLLGPLFGDPLRLRQVATNIMGNAIKFTKQGAVALLIEEYTRDANQVCVKCTVTDTGIGMSAQQLEQVFAPFVQADSSVSRKYGGSGLGLSICKKLVGSMGGDIRVDSVEGQGSTFTWTMYLGVAQAHPPEAWPGSSSEAGD